MLMSYPLRYLNQKCSKMMHHPDLTDRIWQAKDRSICFVADIFHHWWQTSPEIAQRVSIWSRRRQEILRRQVRIARIAMATSPKLEWNLKFLEHAKVLRTVAISNSFTWDHHAFQSGLTKCSNPVWKRCLPCFHMFYFFLSCFNMFCHVMFLHVFLPCLNNMW